MSIRRWLKLSGLCVALGLASLISCSSLPTLVPDMARNAVAVMLARGSRQQALNATVTAL